MLGSAECPEEPDTSTKRNDLEGDVATAAVRVSVGLDTCESPAELASCSAIAISELSSKMGNGHVAVEETTATASSRLWERLTISDRKTYPLVLSMCYAGP